MSDIQRISRRHSERTTSMRDAFEHVQNQKVHNNAAALEEGKCSKLASRYATPLLSCFKGVLQLLLVPVDSDF